MPPTYPTNVLVRNNKFLSTKFMFVEVSQEIVYQSSKMILLEVFASIRSLICFLQAKSGFYALSVKTIFPRFSSKIKSKRVVDMETISWSSPDSILEVLNICEGVSSL